MSKNSDKTVKGPKSRPRRGQSAVRLKVRPEASMNLPASAEEYPSPAELRIQCVDESAANDVPAGIAPSAAAPPAEAPTKKGKPVSSWWRRVAARMAKFQAPKKRLRVCESVSLGDKRFLAIVRVDSQSFLLGGSTGSVAMLARLNEPETFASVLQQTSAGTGLAQ